MLITIQDVRNKNTDLLMTSKISNTAIETCIIDATETVMTRLGEIFTLPIPDEKITPAIKLCIKLFASANCIKDQYSDSETAVSIANSYINEAEKNLKSIVQGNKLQVSEIKPFRRVITYKQNTDFQSDNYINQVNQKYR